MKREVIVDPKGIEDIEDILHDFNQKQPGYPKGQEIAYKYYDDNGNLIGEIYWLIFDEWLEIDSLIVIEEYRGKGFGKYIVNDVEQEAIAKGCTKSLLDSRNYQAPEFYQKLGYKIVFTQEFKDKRANRNWMVKDLT